MSHEKRTNCFAKPLLIIIIFIFSISLYGEIKLPDINIVLNFPTPTNYAPIIEVSPATNNNIVIPGKSNSLTEEQSWNFSWQVFAYTAIIIVLLLVSYCALRKKGDTGNNIKGTLKKCGKSINEFIEKNKFKVSIISVAVAAFIIIIYFSSSLVTKENSKEFFDSISSFWTVVLSVASLFIATITAYFLYKQFKAWYEPNVFIKGIKIKLEYKQADPCLDYELCDLNTEKIISEYVETFIYIPNKNTYGKIENKIHIPFINYGSGSSFNTSLSIDKIENYKFGNILPKETNYIIWEKLNDFIYKELLEKTVEIYEKTNPIYNRIISFKGIIDTLKIVKNDGNNSVWYIYENIEKMLKTYKDIRNISDLVKYIPNMNILSSVEKQLAYIEGEIESIKYKNKNEYEKVKEFYELIEKNFLLLQFNNLKIVMKNEINEFLKKKEFEIQISYEGVLDPYKTNYYLLSLNLNLIEYEKYDKYNDCYNESHDLNKYIFYIDIFSKLFPC